MNYAARINGRSTARRIARTLAGLLLLAQFVAAAHYHTRYVQNDPRATALQVGDTLCPICLYYAHVPTVFSNGPTPLAAPLLLTRVAGFAAQSWPLFSYCAYPFGRSPPALS